MWIALGALTLLAAFAASVVIVLWLRPRPLPLAAVVGLPVLIGAESVILQVLSLASAVNRGALVGANATFVLAVLFVCPSTWRLLAARLREIRSASGLVSLAVALLGGLALISALAYRPNNWDSMTYHLARVAHWMQNGSVAAYRTSVSRQTAYPPGAEYLLLVLQAISRSERLANLLQWAMWCLMVGAARPLARLFGARATAARWAPLIAATLPMGLLQASSTQNDLVAAVIALAVVVSTVPLLHHPERWRRGDLALLTIALVAGLVTKPTSLLAAAPLVLGAVFVGARRIDRRHLPRLARRALPALAAAVVLTTVVARATVPDPFAEWTQRPFVYPGVRQLGDRVVNALRFVVREIAIPLPLFDHLAPNATKGCRQPNALCLDHNLWAHEDYVANPLQAALVFTLLVVAAFRWRRLGGTARLAALGLLGAWLMMSAVLRDNVWVVRLHLPFLALAPLSLGALSGIRRTRFRFALAALVAVGAIATGGAAVVLNARRPIDPARLASGQDAATYYLSAQKEIAAEHEAVLQALATSSCRRLGLQIGGDSFDYPLTWRAMLRGVEVRHVDGAGVWPCLIFSDQGPPADRTDGAPWRQVGSGGLYSTP